MHDPALLTIDHLPELVPFQPLKWNVEKFDFGNDEDRLSAEIDYVLFRAYKHAYSFVLPTQELVHQLADLIKTQFGDSVLDAGSGSGLLSQKLCELGVQAFAVDKVDQSKVSRRGGCSIVKVLKLDEVGDAIPHVKSYPAVLMTWPPFEDTFAYRVAEAMQPGQWLIYEGEGMMVVMLTKSLLQLI